MKRRDLLLAGSALLAAPLLHAQSARPKHRIGLLWPSNADDGKIALQSFHSRLRALDRIEGRDYATELRFADGKPERLPGLARELVALSPNVIVTASSAGVAALQKATATIPVVFAGAASPVEQGFIQSLAKPGGNITGVTLRGELNVKVVEIAREILPGMRRVALLLHENDPVSPRVAEQYQRAADIMKLHLDVIQVTRVEELQRAVTQAASSRADVLVVPALTLFILHAEKIAEVAAKARLPLIGSFSRVAPRGGLLSYYSDLRESYSRAAILVDKILKGGKPADIPVEQPDRFRLVINLRTAKALGIAIPPSVLARADEVIE